MFRMYDSPSLQYNCIPCCVDWLPLLCKFVLFGPTAVPPAATRPNENLLVCSQFQPCVSFSDNLALQPLFTVAVYKYTAFFDGCGSFNVKIGKSQGRNEWISNTNERTRRQKSAPQMKISGFGNRFFLRGEQTSNVLFELFPYWYLYHVCTVLHPCIAVCLSKVRPTVDRLSFTTPRTSLPFWPTNRCRHFLSEDNMLQNDESMMQHTTIMLEA